MSTAGYADEKFQTGMIDSINNAFFKDPNALCAVSCGDPYALGVVLAATNDSKAIVMTMEDTMDKNHRLETSECTTSAWSERYRVISRRLTARVKNQKRTKSSTDDAPYVYGVTLGALDDSLVENYDVNIIVCHFMSGDLRRATSVMSVVHDKLRSVGNRDGVMVVMSFDQVPHAVGDLLESSAGALKRDTAFSQFTYEPDPAAPCKIIRRTMPDMKPLGEDRVSSLSRTQPDLSEAYQCQIERMTECSFDIVIRDWAANLRAKNPQISVACVTYHASAQQILEQTFSRAGMEYISVWTVQQVHQTRSMCMQQPVPHLLILCEPQINPWDTWFCISKFGYENPTLRVGMCFWSPLDVMVHELDGDKFNFVSQWTETHANIVRGWVK